MKKIIWAGLVVLLAGGAFMTATAIDKKPKPEARPTAEKSTPAPESAQSSGSPFKNAEDAKKAAEKVTEPTIEPIAYGKANAPIMMEEFASFTCSHCAHFHSDTLPDLTKKYIDSGKVQLRLNSFIRNEQDLRATMLVYCVEGNEKRQNFVKALLKSQEQWAFDSDFVKNLRVMAQVGGVSNEKFDQCMADKTLEDKLLKNREYGAYRGVDSTPFFLIGQEAVTGARDMETFSEAIESALKAKAK